MAASLDDLLDELRTMTAVLEDIRDNGAGAGGGAGQSGGAATQGASGKAAGGGPGLLGGLSKGFNKVAAGISAAEGIADFTGLSEGLRQSNLGASGGEAVSSGVRSLARIVSDLPFGGIFAANTQQVFAGQDRAQQSVSGIVESIARAGGKTSDESISAALKRQNEIEANVQKAKVRVGQLQAVEGEGELSEAAGKDAGAIGGALGSLLPEIRALTDAIRAMLGTR